MLVFAAILKFASGVGQNNFAVQILPSLLNYLKCLFNLYNISMCYLGREIDLMNCQAPDLFCHEPTTGVFMLA